MESLKYSTHPSIRMPGHILPFYLCLRPSLSLSLCVLCGHFSNIRCVRNPNRITLSLSTSLHFHLLCCFCTFIPSLLFCVSVVFTRLYFNLSIWYLIKNKHCRMKCVHYSNTLISIYIHEFAVPASDCLRKSQSNGVYNGYKWDGTCKMYCDFSMLYRDKT